jgi:pimeloyl-ACP methyl ester carboxylesterase
MADVLLIHGSAHGAWCWEAMLPRLAALGHTARAIDLPGHGKDTTPISDVTLDRYARAISDACGPQTFLVGHSMGGYAITAAAGLAAPRIAKLIYLCAYVPKDGVSLAEMRMMAPSQPLLPAIRMREDGLGFVIDPVMAPELFYNDCPPDVSQAATRHLGVQALAPNTTPISITAEIAALPRHYIRCMDDRTIPPAFQVTMTQDWPESDVQTMQTGHSPFLSAPDELAARLDRAIRG